MLKKHMFNRYPVPHLPIIGETFCGVLPETLRHRVEEDIKRSRFITTLAVSYTHLFWTRDSRSAMRTWKQPFAMPWTTWAGDSRYRPAVVIETARIHFSGPNFFRARRRRRFKQGLKAACC